MRSLWLPLLLGPLSVCQCAMMESLRAKSAIDLDCPARTLQCRGDVAERGARWVAGCGKYAKYVNTSEGWVMRDIGEGAWPAAAFSRCLF